MKYLISLLILSVFSCQSQTEKVLSNNEIDLHLKNIYQKYHDNRHDYADIYGEARDTILIRFKEDLIEILKHDSYKKASFDSLSNYVNIISSNDKKLKIFSWDELNGGTWHIYNSAFQYENNGKLFAGFLSLKQDTTNNPLFTDINHYKIYEIENDKYLVKGYGTHGSGKEFFVYRLLSFENDKIIDCSKCFDGKDRFIYEISRGDKLEPKYNNSLKIISYHELVESYIQGNKDEPSGFMEASGKILKLQYKDGKFVISNN